MKTATKAFAVVLALWAVTLGAAEPEHVKARLVSDSSNVEPGQTMRLGVLFEMDPGWHVYWKNPGDSGIPTDIDFTLPEGFSNGPIQWPVPTAFPDPGGHVAYGYGEEVILASNLQIPDALPDGELLVKAAVSWLACKNVCILGSADLETTLPLSSAQVASTKGLFQHWEAELPRGGDGSDLPFTASTTGGIPAGEKSGTLSVWLQWKQPPHTIQVYPAVGSDLKVSSPKVQTRGNLTRVDMELKRIGPPSDWAEEFTTIIATTDQSGARQGWETITPIGTK